MKDKKVIVSIIIAGIVALIITFVVRYFMPNSAGTAVSGAKHELSMPEIPLMAKKEERKKREYQVLILARDVRKDEKIMQDSVAWKKWPEDSVQPTFIAKDEQGQPLNNVSDYSNALTMWAKSDLPYGVPLTISMLTSEDPVKKAKEEAERKKEEEVKALEEKVASEFIHPGMRAITFQVDQRTASSSNMIKAGDLVDVLIVEQKGDRSITHKYRALKILAVDGVTEYDLRQRAKNEGKSISELMSVSVGGFSTPKNVMLEIKEDMVDIMLKQSERSGVILSIRSQNEKEPEEEEAEDEENSESKKQQQASNEMVQSMFNSGRSPASSAMLSNKEDQDSKRLEMSMLIHSINKLEQQTSVNALKSQEEDKHKNEMLINSMNNMGSSSSREAMSKEQGEKENLNMLINSMNLSNSDAKKSLAQEEEKKTSLEALMHNMNSFGGASMSDGWKQKGAGLGGSDEEKSVTIYRKLTSSGVQFDEEGKVVAGSGGQSGQ